MSANPAIDPSVRSERSTSAAVPPSRRKVEWTAGRMRLLLLFPALCAVATTGSLVYLSGLFDSDFWAESPSTGAAIGRVVVGIVTGGICGLLAALPLLVLIALGKRYWWKGAPPTGRRSHQ